MTFLCAKTSTKKLKPFDTRPYEEIAKEYGLHKENKVHDYCDRDDVCENKIVKCSECTRNFYYEEADDWFSEKEEASG